MNTELRDRLIELLAIEATQALPEPEAQELAVLLEMYPDVDPNMLAHAAAAADLALTGDTEAIPPHLAARIESQAMIRFGVQPLVEPAYRPPPQSGSSRLSYLGWAFAAGLAAVVLWYAMPKPTRTLAEQVAELKKLPDTLEFKDQRANVSGEIVWNPSRHEGFLEVRGLPALDSTKEQYQLWIVDAGRTDPNHPQPIDGGVFDVKPDGTILIPIRAAIQVKDAAAFAITKEAAGGVVVSKGPHLLVLVPPKAG